MSLEHAIIWIRVTDQWVKTLDRLKNRNQRLSSNERSGKNEDGDSYGWMQKCSKRKV